MNPRDVEALIDRRTSERAMAKTLSPATLADPVAPGGVE
jgi:hypothetical protein